MSHLKINITTDRFGIASLKILSVLSDGGHLRGEEATLYHIALAANVKYTKTVADAIINALEPMPTLRKYSYPQDDYISLFVATPNGNSVSRFETQNRDELVEAIAHVTTKLNDAIDAARAAGESAITEQFIQSIEHHLSPITGIMVPSK